MMQRYSEGERVLPLALVTTTTPAHHPTDPAAYEWPPLTKEMLMRGNGKTNEFGQTILAGDYGHDDLNAHNVDLPTADAVARDQAISDLIDRLVPMVGEIPTPVETTRTKAVLAAHVDLDAHLVVLGDEDREVRDPDVIEDGMAVWVGEVSTVAMPAMTLGTAEVERIVGNAGYFARQGVWPAEKGITITSLAEAGTPETYRPDFAHPSVSLSMQARDHGCHTAWRQVTDAMLKVAVLDEVDA